MVKITSGCGLYGRRRIFASTDDITPENVVNVVNNALDTHMANMIEEEYLHWYRRGMQPILNRTKERRSDILNKCVINNADMVVTFKDGYFLTKPATYVSRKDDEGVTNKVKELNEYVALSGKYEADNQVVDWFHTVGLGALYVSANSEEGIPFRVFALDPRSAFVVYSMTPGNEPVLGVNMVVRDGYLWIDAFAKDYIYRIKGAELTDSDIRYGIGRFDTAQNELIDTQRNLIGEIPIVEYTYNKLRMGSFENSLSIMDEINNIQSNRADGIEQFIQSLTILYNCEVAEGTTADDIRKMGFIALKNTGDNKADIKVLTEQLDQTQTQVTLDDLYEQLLDKVGMPSLMRDSGSTSDTGTAVYLRNGWATADTCARNTEDEFKKANAYFDRIILAICRKKIKGFDLTRADFELKIIRNDLSNLLVKTQAALNMKDLGFAPALAFERSGLSNDPLTDVEVSKEYIEKTWGSGEEEETEEGNQRNVRGRYVNGYWRNNNGQKSEKPQKVAAQDALEPKDGLKGGEPNVDKA